ncbi:MAG: insulinase family protein [Salinivirgaceae bacterium]
MKNLSIILTALILTFSFSACDLDRSKRPKAGPAPEIKMGESKTFTLDNGLQVIVVENHKTPTVAFQLTVDTDPVLEKDAAGYLDATGELMRTGTENRTKQEIDEALDFIGARFYISSKGIYGNTLTKFKGDFLDVMADITLNPIFPASELEKYKKQTISGLATQENEPNAMAANVAKMLRYGKNHPYGEVVTKETVKNITRDICVDCYKTYFRPNTSYLTIVGDITVDEAKQLAEKHFGQWEKAEVPKHEYKTPKAPEGNQVAIAHKDGAVQSVIKITYPIDLKISDEDAIPAKVMNEILGGGVFSGRLMQNIREDKGYTYGARSQIVNDELVGYFSAGAEVGTEVTDSAIHEFLYEMKRMVDEKVTEEHLDLVKQVETGSFARAMESSQTIARFALNIERYNLPADYYATYLKKLNAVTVKQVKEMAEKYIKPENVYIVVAGDKSELKKTLKRFDSDGKIQIYDAWGNELEDNTTVPTDITAQEVIDNYIKAIGGAEEMKKMKTVKQEGEIEMQGQKIATTLIKKAPNKMMNEMTMQGMTVQKQVFDGEKGFTAGMQGEKDMEGEELAALKVESTMNIELKYDELGYELELVEIEKVDGNDAYKIKVTPPSGDSYYNFFDVESGLKVMSKKTMKTEQGAMDQVQTFSNYKAVDGIKFAHTITISSTGMPEPMKMQMNKIEVNPKVDDAVFTK